MKKIILIIVMISGYIAVSAQKHTLNPALDKFVGTWVYKNGEKEVTIILKKIQVPVTLKDIL